MSSRFSNTDDTRADGGGWRSVPSSSGPPSGSRTKLNLKKKGEAPVDSGSAPPALKDEEPGSKEQKRREPKVVNSRAAAFGDAPTARGGTQQRREPRDRDDNNRNSDNRGPPPVLNTRFANLAEEERERNRNENKDRDNNRMGGRDDRGSSMLGPPPPVQNSRFAAAAEADRSYNSNPSDRGNYNSRDQGPPPVQNSRFAAAALADGRRDNEPSFRDSRGPPPVQNSRFAAAAAMAEGENAEREERRQNRTGGHDNDRGPSSFGRRDDRGPPLPQNSRFAAAAEEDPDYVNREDRMREQERAAEERGEQGGSRFGGGGGYNDRRGGGGGFGGGCYNDRGGGGGGVFNRDELPRGPRGIMEDLPRGPRDSDFPTGNSSAGNSRLDSLLKPKAPPAMDNFLAVPKEKLSAEHAENVLKIPTKKKDPEPEKETEKKEAGKVSEPEPEPVVEEKPQINVEELCEEFASCKMQGEELKQWVEEKGAGLPSVENLLFYFLEENQKLNPDIDCAWAAPDKWGSALLALCEGNLYNQMQILWAIQKYCDKLGFPKLDDEYVVQAMFRSMYKFDLALDDAFAEWKEDESDEHSDGKLKAVIQTVNWFTWLEEDDEEEEDGEEELLEE